MFLCAYPNTQALALPLEKDKQRKKAHVLRIYTHTTAHQSQAYIYTDYPQGGSTPYYIYKGKWPQGY